MLLDGRVTALAWQPRLDEQPLLAIGAGRRVTLVDPRGSIVLEGANETSTVLDVAWSVDGSRIGAAAYGGISWYDPDRNGRSRRFTWKGSLLCLALSPDGRWACAGAQDANRPVRPTSATSPPSAGAWTDAG